MTFGILIPGHLFHLILAFEVSSWLRHHETVDSSALSEPNCGGPLLKHMDDAFLLLSYSSILHLSAVRRGGPMSG